ncbi:phosphate acetyl/butaryl transferase family protein [[Clostridium] sordellii ATCC 9714]|nr:phosphate acetyl/butaryl transferase family protein [[Clostridium] sordellii ATCC 9714] [Paeniclostridium sordellii ATCC 9714]
MIRNLDDIISDLKLDRKVKLAVAAAQDEEVLHAVLDAMNKNIIEPILIGDIDKIKKISYELNFNLENISLIKAYTYKECAEIAVKLVSDKKADFLMKGILDTSILLKLF